MIELTPFPGPSERDIVVRTQSCVATENRRTFVCDRHNFYFGNFLFSDMFSFMIPVGGTNFVSIDITKKSIMEEKKTLASFTLICLKSSSELQKALFYFLHYKLHLFETPLNLWQRSCSQNKGQVTWSRDRAHTRTHFVYIVVNSGVTILAVGY